MHQNLRSSSAYQVNANCMQLRQSWAKDWWLSFEAVYLIYSFFLSCIEFMKSIRPPEGSRTDVCSSAAFNRRRLKGEAIMHNVPPCLPPVNQAGCCKKTHVWLIHQTLVWGQKRVRCIQPTFSQSMRKRADLIGVTVSGRFMTVWRPSICYCFNCNCIVSDVRLDWGGIGEAMTHCEMDDRGLALHQLHLPRNTTLSGASGLAFLRPFVCLWACLSSLFPSLACRKVEV